MTGKSDAFKVFLKQNKETINVMINATFPLIEDAIAVRIRRGFELSVKPCFQAFLSSRNADAITGPDARMLLNMIKLLAISIKKRYYAFPDKHVIAVDHDELFNTVLPAAIKHELIDTNIDFAIIMFNAGENLGEPSARFYQIVARTIDIFPKDGATQKDLVHVLAWLAGDVMRKEKAIQILKKNVDIRNVTFKILLGKDDTTPLVQGSPEVSRRGERVIDALTVDPWLDAMRMNDDSLKKDGLRDTTLVASTSISRIGVAGGYEGFGGPFDTPPRIAGMISSGMLVAFTGSGKIYHVAYGATGTQARVIGLHPDSRLLYSPGCGLVAIEQRNRALNLKNNTKVHSLGKGQQYQHASLAGETLFFSVSGENEIKWTIATGTNGSHGSGSIEWKKDIGQLVAMDSDRALIATKDAIHELRVPGTIRTVVKMQGMEWMAAMEGHVFVISSSGTACLVDLENRTTTKLNGTIDARGITSLAMNKREIALTRAHTHAIQFYGTPALE